MWPNRKKKHEVKFPATYDNKQLVIKIARFLSLHRWRGKALWTQDDTLEYIIMNRLSDRTYIESNKRYFRPDRPFHYNENSLYYADIGSSKWQSKLPSSWLYPLSVRLDIPWYHRLSSFAYSLDLKPGVAARKIVEDTLRTPQALLLVVPGYTEERIKNEKIFNNQIR